MGLMGLGFEDWFCGILVRWFGWFDGFWVLALICGLTQYTGLTAFGVFSL